MSTFTPSGSSGAIETVVVSGGVTATLAGAANPTIANVPLASAATEYSYTLPANTKKFYIQLRDPVAELQLSYSVGTSGSNYVTVHRGCWYSEEELTTSVTLYFQSATAAQIAEIVSWV